MRRKAWWPCFALALCVGCCIGPAPAPIGRMADTALRAVLPARTYDSLLRDEPVYDSGTIFIGGAEG